MEVKRKLFLYFYLLLTTVYGKPVIGQLSIPEGFPTAGDTLNIFRVEYKGMIDTRGNARNLSWNFMYLDPSHSNETIFRNKTAGRHHHRFPNADIVMLESNGKETYYKISNPTIYEIGQAGDQLYFNNLFALIRYDTPSVIKQSGLKYNDRYTENYQYSIALHTSNIEGWDAMSIPFRTDSIRLDISVRKERTVDADGELLLPFSSHKVIREREDVILDYSITGRAGLGWLDITDRVITMPKGRFPPSQLRLTNYYFWSPSHFIPVLTAKSKPQGGWLLEFPDDNFSTRLSRSRVLEKDILAHPNPTFGDIQFQLVNYPKANYELKIFNIVGRPIYTKKFAIGDSRKVDIDLSFLSKGTYLYSIMDEAGNKLVTKKLVILRP